MIAPQLKQGGASCRSNLGYELTTPNSRTSAKPKRRSESTCGSGIDRLTLSKLKPFPRLAAERAGAAWWRRSVSNGLCRRHLSVYLSDRSPRDNRNTTLPSSAPIKALRRRRTPQSRLSNGHKLCESNHVTHRLSRALLPPRAPKSP
jgi:hypothetical protein